MKIKCTRKLSGITLGKVYQVHANSSLIGKGFNIYDKSNWGYLIINDRNIECVISKKFFILIKEYANG
jgi:hypothetical protein